VALRRAWWIATLVLVVPGVADARPKRRDAKAQFDRGIALYKKGNYAAASDALGKSFNLERDVETLFAWAQAERKLENCDKAVELYGKLLASNLPPANQSAVETKLAECRAILAQQAPVEPAEPAVVEAKPEPPQPPAVAEPAPAVAEPARPGAAAADGYAWYKDPITLTLLGTGAVGLAAGTGLLVSARALDRKVPTGYDEAKRNAEQARSRGNLGMIAAGVGSVVLVGGVIWIVTHRGSPEQPTVTGWLGDGGGGLAWAGAF
jgi:tetratricopeptide (TPR) repeat protein